MLRWSAYTVLQCSFSFLSDNVGWLLFCLHRWLAYTAWQDSCYTHWFSLYLECVWSGGGVTPIDSLVTAATVGHNLHQLVWVVQTWTTTQQLSEFWPLTALYFNHWPLTNHTFCPDVHVADSTSPLVHRVKMRGLSCDHGEYWSDPLLHNIHPVEKAWLASLWYSSHPPCS